MAGMWEFPLLAAVERDGNAILAKFRHSITDTDYEVSVAAVSPKALQELGAGRWFATAAVAAAGVDWPGTQDPAEARA